MKKKTINFNWPATLSFSAEKSDDENERFSRGKLKVFYIGETADHRLFSEEYGKEVVKSLPYTPIVSFYDEEKDDFVGHATQQAIYGIVDPCTGITFEKDEDGNEWAVCGTIYYTERPDKVGEIAKKIEGHNQSLELDPSTVEYVVNYDSKKHFKNIEFTAGKFIGVSVLGKDQRPAFTGSSFFAIEEFEDKMQILRDYCEKQNVEEHSGDDTMNLDEFMTLSWGDKTQKVGEALQAAYANEYYLYLVDMFDDSAICRMYSYIDGKCSLNRVKYSIDDTGAVTLGDVNEVHVVYEDVPDPSISNHTDLNGEGDNHVDPVTPEGNADDTFNAEPVTESTVVEDPAPVADPQPVDPEPVSNPAPVADPEPVADPAQDFTADPITEPQKGVEPDATITQEEGTSSTTFTDGERAELETLKREKKESLIISFSEKLPSEILDSFTARIDEFDYDNLEKELALAYSKQDEPTSVRIFAPLDTNNTTNGEKTTGALIKQYLN